MSAVISVAVNQVGPATAEGAVRDHRVLVDRPATKGGEDRGAMGGELLLVALGGCFMSNLLAAIRAREAAVEKVRITVEGTLASAPPRFEAITMRIAAEYEAGDRELMEKLVTISERGCIVANTLKGGTPLTLVVE